MHTHSIVCATVEGQCLEYLIYITLPKGKKDSTVGEVVNLMSVDVEKLFQLMPFIGYGWSVPFQITIALYLLYQTLGASAFAGFFLMIILIPINGGMVAKQVKLCLFHLLVQK